MRRALFTAGMLIAAALAARAVVGPYQLWRFHVASPFTLESMFVAVAAVLAWPAAGPSGLQEPEAWTARQNALACMADCACCCRRFAPNLRDPFLSDDYILVKTPLDRIPELFRAGGGDGAYRPLGYIYYGLVHRIAGTNAVLWHAASLALHIVNCLLVFAVVVSLWPRKRAAALMAALLFGLNGTRPEVVTWTSGAFDLLACLFTLLAVCCVFSFSAHAPSRIALALLLLLAAILSKESAYAGPVIIGGLAVAAGRWRDRTVARFLFGSLSSRRRCWHGGGFSSTVPAAISIQLPAGPRYYPCTSSRS